MDREQERTYSIGELAEEVGVSTRTIRYYVSEGLLPPPIGSGPGSRYTDAHRAQLETINRLKEQYLPLKEIRKRLIGHGAPPPAQAPVTGSHFATLGFTAGGAISSPAPAEHFNASMPANAFAIDDASSFHAFADDLPLAPAPPEEGHAWRRITISDEAELMITEGQYRRNQGQVDWLIQWARKVFGS